MNKNAIQKYAVWARNELIEQIKQRAFQYGISDKGYGDENAAVIAGRVLAPEEKRQRHEFVVQIKAHGFEQAVEEVAYTWFNRFVALRYMEVNDYLPTHVRVLSDANGSFNPEILKDVLHLDLPGLDKVKVSDLLNANKTEELYRYLLLTQCNALNDALPEMFEKLGSYTEMLLPNNILKPDSVLGRLVTDIPEEDWKDAVQIIGWMYQYYNTEPKQAVFDGLKKNVKITKEKIPAATQLFTPDWIVRYMVENSLGRLWLESHPNDALKANWKYYLDEAEQTPEVAEKLRVMRSQSPVKSPEDIRLIDPCMGSGHILVYAFDVLMQIYESVGVSPRDAAKLILEKNIYGLDIDRRAYQLAYFSLMMKARQYNRRIFTEDVKPQVYYPAGWSDGEEYGSLVKVDRLDPMPELPKEQQMTLFDGSYDVKLNAWNFKRLLAQKYDVVVTNPPYMGRRKSMTDTLSSFIDENYGKAKMDLFSAFMLQNINLTKNSGFCGFMTPFVWLYLNSYEELRQQLMVEGSIQTLVQLEEGAFADAAVSICTFVFRKNPFNYSGVYLNLKDYIGEDIQPVKVREAKVNPNLHFVYSRNMYTFKRIPEQRYVFWISDTTIQSFENKSLEQNIAIKQGITTSDNERFLRKWFEVQIGNVGFSLSAGEAKVSKCKWFPYSKGGENRKWYGNNEYVMNYRNDGEEIKAFHDILNKTNPGGRLKNREYYFMKSLTWSDICGSSFAVRANSIGFLFDVKGSSAFASDELYEYILGLMNSKVVLLFCNILNPSVTTQVGDIKAIPLIICSEKSAAVKQFATSNIDLSRADWDSFETSWDFKRHPLLCGEHTVAAAFAKWEREAAERFNALKANEEELNRIFIDIYGLQNELTSEIEDKDVTVRRADLGREIRSLISYAVGCMFGRYSLDTEGLVYAGGEWDAGKYRSFIPDKDNILPICDDEYFDDDILGRFVDFVRVVFGAETLEENLKFIADVLGGKGTPREVIRSYFLNDFYTDHCKIYQKRPIYWLFDSGKKNGFKALVYLHRYQSDLLAKLRTDYVHEQQERYRTQLSHITSALNTATGSERARLLKQQDKLTEQLKEITAFEEKVHHLADQNIEIDLDDGVKKNYEIFTDVLAKI